jgi:phosphohistidine phosphatase
MKRLYLLRHAKTEQANKDTPADADRALTETGREEARLAGIAMRTNGYAPDLILCSPSKRTRQTLEIANIELKSDAEIQYVDAIYGASARRLIAVFQQLPDPVERPLIVGHNPGFEDGLASLTGGGHRKFPTGAVAVLDFEIRKWTDLKTGSGTLAALVRPNDVASS